MFTWVTTAVNKLKLHSGKTSNLNMPAFWATAPCSLVQIHGHFGRAYCFRNHRPDDGGSTHL